MIAAIPASRRRRSGHALPFAAPAPLSSVSVSSIPLAQQPRRVGGDAQVRERLRRCREDRWQVAKRGKLQPDQAIEQSAVNPLCILKVSVRC